MADVRISYDLDEKISEYLVGRSIVAVDETTLTLSDGSKLTFDKQNDECCSSIDLITLSACENLITAVEVCDNEDETGGEGEYKAWIQVITDAGTQIIAEADGNASNGYYLHGFALGVTVSVPDA